MFYRVDEVLVPALPKTNVPQSFIKQTCNPIGNFTNSDSNNLTDNNTINNRRQFDIQPCTGNLFQTLLCTVDNWNHLCDYMVNYKTLELLSPAIHRHFTD